MKLKICVSFLLAFCVALAAQAPVAPLLNPQSFWSANVAADTATLTVNQVSQGVLKGTPTSAATYTTPSATAWCAAFPQLANQGASNGWFDLYVLNTSAGANAITLAGGSGVTLRGTGTAAQNAERHFRVIFKCTGTPAIDLLSLETATF